MDVINGIDLLNRKLGIITISANHYSYSKYPQSKEVVSKYAQMFHTKIFRNHEIGRDGDPLISLQMIEY